MRENHSIHAWHSQQGTAAIYFSSLRGGSHGQDLAELGKKVLKSERDFNKAAGFTARHDRLPRFMTLEPIAPHTAGNGSLTLKMRRSAVKSHDLHQSLSVSNYLNGVVPERLPVQVRVEGARREA
jgi:aldehyde:ferredoxin oxidoreductase